MSRWNKDSFYYTCLQTQKKIFAYEGDKAKVLAGLKRLAARKQFDVLAFSLLDDEFHLLYAASGRRKITGEEIFAELTGSYLPGYRKLCGGEEISSSRRVTECELKEGGRVVECCMDIHMRAVEEMVVSTPNDYWWASFPVYRGQELWDFVDTDRVLKLISADPIAAGAQFLREHRRRLRLGRKKDRSC